MHWDRDLVMGGYEGWADVELINVYILYSQTLAFAMPLAVLNLPSFSFIYPFSSTFSFRFAFPLLKKKKRRG